MTDVLYWIAVGAAALAWVCIVADHLLASRERRERLEWKQFMRGAVR